MKTRRTLVLALGVSVGALVAVASAGRPSRTRQSHTKGLAESNTISKYKLENPDDSEVYYI